uniref:Sulfotransferase domain-containing protein n=1 Tax=Arion vulgaris TaxID=1028688 RepID=A0A0B6ZS08_9EUPU
MAIIRRKFTKFVFICCLSVCILMVYFYTQAVSSVIQFTARYSDAKGQSVDIPLPHLPKDVLLFDSGPKHEEQQRRARERYDNKNIPAAQAQHVPVKITNTTLNSYRALPHIEGLMETNKIMHDDYNFCPRIEPFLGSYNYNSQTKNPCWMDNGVFRCVPYFYIAGFSKCGTSDLYYKLAHHPDVLATGWKEKHWFDYNRFAEDMRFIQNYTDMFKDMSTKIEADFNKNGYSRKITGDGTPCYVWGSLNWPCYEGNEGLSEPRYTNADIIYRLNPNTKIIICLREPVSRLYSRLLTWIDEPLHPVYKNASPISFHNFIVERIAMHEDCFKRWSIRHCAYNGTLYQEAVLRLMESAYSVYVRDWLKVFPRQQILFIRFEDYVTNLDDTLKKVFSFLELAPLPEETMQKMLNSGTANVGKHYNFGPMLNETRYILREFYQQFNDELAEMLNDADFNWNTIY